MENESKETIKEDTTDYKVVALALAKDLVEMSESVRKVLANSTFNFNIMDEVRLLEMTTAQVIETYLTNNKEEVESEKEA